MREPVTRASPPLSPLRVLATADSVGGVWTYALDLARTLADSGVRTTLAVPGPAPDAGQRRDAEAIGIELRPLGGALDWTAAAPAEIDAAGMRLARLADALAPDLIHLNSPALAANVRFRVPVVGGCHSCLKTWWAAVRGAAPLPGDFAWRVEMTRRGYAACDALVAPSLAFAEATRRAYDLAAAPRVVHNGRAAPTTSTVREMGRFVFTAGRLWDEGKDVATLDRAAARLEMKVTAAGPVHGPNGASITFEHLGAPGKLEPGLLQDYLSLRPIFVSPARYEPFGLAVLEAAQAGCPLVLSDIGAFRELWDGAALFFPPGDDGALTSMLQALGADAGRRAALGEAARAHAGRYTAQAMGAGTLELYREVLGPRGAGRAVA